MDPLEIDKIQGDGDEELPRKKISLEIEINSEKGALELKIRTVLRYFINCVVSALHGKLEGKSGQEVETVKAILERILKNLENDGILNNPENAGKETVTDEDPANLNITIDENVLAQSAHLALRAKNLLTEVEIDCPELEDFANLCRSGL